jgi:hypothetical protein
MVRAFALATLVSLAVAASAVRAQESPVDVAKELENPIYYRTTVPFQTEYECCFSPETGYKYEETLKPIIPIGRIGDVEVVSRTLFPIEYEFNNNPGQGGHVGVGDTLQAFYFGHESGRAFYYGFGPIFLIPSHDPQLSDDKWGMGPTFAVGGEKGPYTASFLFWHYWSFAGQASAAPVSKTRLEPKFGYTFPDSTTLKIGVEADYDWINHTWSAPFRAGASHVFKVGKDFLHLELEGEAFNPTAKGPQAGVRFTATWRFPR